MNDSDVHRELMGVLVHTAQAHHAATGGANPQWATWYAEHSVDDMNRLLGTEMSVAELADWLAAADRRYAGDGPEESWPRAYATWLLEAPR